MARPSKAGEFLKSVRSKATTVNVNGHTVNLKPLSVRELVAFRQWHSDHKDDPGAGFSFMRKVVAASVVDDDGAPILSEEDADGLDMPTLAKIADAIGELNGFEVSEPGKPQPGAAS